MSRSISGRQAPVNFVDSYTALKTNSHILCPRPRYDYSMHGTSDHAVCVMSLHAHRETNILFAHCEGNTGDNTLARYPLPYYTRGKNVALALMYWSMLSLISMAPATASDIRQRKQWKRPVHSVCVSSHALCRRCGPSHCPRQGKEREK